MEKTLRSLSQISFFFFLVFGALHISASLLVAQGVIDRTSWVLFNAFDLPFLFAGLIYADAKLSLGLGSIAGDVKLPFVLLTVLFSVLFLVALYWNFLLPDASFI